VQVNGAVMKYMFKPISIQYVSFFPVGLYKLNMQLTDSLDKRLVSTLEPEM
jgi:hypothetical protein